MVTNVGEKYLKMNIHILGICGTFMGGLAQILIEKGYKVSGSDHQFYPPMSDQLDLLGVEMIKGYGASDLPKADLYVIGNVLSRGNESVEYILNNKLSYTSGPQMLGEMIKDKIVIAVSGTHGKTSTSFMLCEIFLHEKIDIGYLVGGVSQSFDSSARLGSSEFFIIEADEYDSAFFDKRSKFIHYNSDTFIINNIEFDHADIFSDLDDIYKQFHHAVRTVPANGNVLIHKNDKNAKKLLDMGCWAKKHELGREDSISFNKSSILFKGEEFDLNVLPFLGTHNYQNAIMAIYAAYLHGIHPGKSYEALLQFKGVKRRFEIIYQDENKVIIDDFAHHPTAISSTINAAKSFSGKKKILGIIELGSNTMSSGYHGEELFKSAEGLDKVLWLNLSKKIDQENVYNAIEPLLDELKKILDQYNVILIMSNKDSKKITEPIIEQIAH